MIAIVEEAIMVTYAMDLKMIGIVDTIKALEIQKIAMFGAVMIVNLISVLDA
jgi:hypothetical protein